MRCETQAVAAAARELEIGRKKEFVDSTLGQFKLDMDVKAEKRDVLRSKLAKEKQQRVEALEIQVMEEKAALPELNEFEKSQANKRIKGTVLLSGAFSEHPFIIVDDDDDDDAVFVVDLEM